MKEWNAPDLTELSINETANGKYDHSVEDFPCVNDKNRPVTPDTKS